VSRGVGPAVGPSVGPGTGVGAAVGLAVGAEVVASVRPAPPLEISTFVGGGVWFMSRACHTA